jgi:hypothetical protein
MAVLLLVGCGSDSLGPPQEELDGMVSSEWVIEWEEGTAPELWEGPETCLRAHLTSPEEEYYEPNGHFDYVAFHYFWFCPKAWEGNQKCLDCPEEGTFGQEYPARFLCESSDYKLFHLSLGENSEEELPVRVAKRFCGTAPRGDYYSPGE